MVEEKKDEIKELEKVELEYLGQFVSRNIDGKLHEMNHRDRITVSRKAAEAQSSKEPSKWHIHKVEE